LSFRRTEVDRGDLISALETILDELKAAADAEPTAAVASPRESSGSASGSDHPEASPQALEEE